MVSFKLDIRSTKEVLDKIMGQWAFLVQKELIKRFPESFKNRIVVVKEGAAWIVGSNYNILKFYDKGTKPHFISPKVKKALAFKWPSAPGIPGQPKGGKFLFKKVLHPGTKGKDVLDNLEKDKRTLKRLLKQAIRNVVK